MNRKNMTMVFVFLLLLLIVLTSMWMFTNRTTMKTMERDADVIVSGTCGIRELKETKDGKNNDFYAEYIRNFSVEKVYKNKNDLIKDEEIVVWEKEHLQPDLTSKEENMFFKDGYVSMLENRQYMLFLKYSEKEDVFTVLEYGKIPLDKEEHIFSSEGKQKKTADREQEIQKKIAEDVWEKYAK